MENIVNELICLGELYMYTEDSLYYFLAVLMDLFPNTTFHYYFTSKGFHLITHAYI
ncbi:hypothetical protein BGM26_20015 [Bacillus sp. FJAT-29790]|uniref:hypothetical protein n=1 Tax=Bacillus sp. FJAT-29790 TaxID=1895002 RepID=UPI001C232454|nr:hypothetical protein [Bacillus sp. FJAT-29790]MBU8881214.1 hypothetical protein [Bacillus sp. FJAT-29790]